MPTYVEKEKGKFKQCKNLIFKGWHLKGLTHVLQSKNIRIKNFKGKKVLFTKFAGVLL
jgi:hypothetical protein